jgi:regulator of ribonuclease activity A
MPFKTADLVDAHAAKLKSCNTQFLDYGGRASFFGAIRTVKTFEDNALIKKALSTPGEGHVLVIDGAASLRCALVGDVIAGLAAANGWSGLVIWGAVRDIGALKQIDLGIKALGSNPWKSSKVGRGELDVPVGFGGMEFFPGHYLYSDADGIVVSEQALPDAN